MTVTQLWGTLLIFIVCPLLGGLPLIDWITYGLTGRRLAQLGTGNISVSAAFYQGGRLAGILAVTSEALKGVAAVLLARWFFPGDPAWEIIALIALVMGRYWVGRGAGTTNVVWGYMVHDWVSAGLIFLIGGITFTVLRERQLGKLGILVLLPLITGLRHPSDGALIGATVTLSLLLGWIYQKIPDDLDLPSNSSQRGSRQMFRFFRGDRALLSLDRPLASNRVGQKAATLAQLKRWGYPVVPGWVLPPGDDPSPLIEALQPSDTAPLIVRSSAIGEDSESASAAGQYESIPNITSRKALEQAILRCLASYTLPTAVRYRRDRQVPDDGMSILVQHQIQGVFSGVAFSRDPISRQGDAVVIEAMPGSAAQVVSGQVTPEQYRVWVHDDDIQILDRVETSGWILPDALEFGVDGAGEVPPRLIQQVAYLARHLEIRFHGIPQDIEWSYDGQQLWLLQARPITTLLPIWTRKIAAEVIPGFIHPLTWSINRPLTCGVWGDLFSVVLGHRVRGLDFNQTATLHHSAAYFNASLLGELFRRMGLPPESLEFLTRGARFSRPPLKTTLQNLSGLLRLLRLELQLEADFIRDMQSSFAPGLAELERQPAANLLPEMQRRRIYQILKLLKRATYYSIMAPLSASLRRTLFRVKEGTLDSSQTPEVASLRSLRALADQFRSQFPHLNQSSSQPATFADLTKTEAGQALMHQFDQFLKDYGYLSEVATDIAVPTWQDDPRPVQHLLMQFLVNPAPGVSTVTTSQTWKGRLVQPRLNLKGQVTAVYSKLLAELRWSIVALEQHWLKSGWLTQPGDIFFLTFDELESLITEGNSTWKHLAQQIADRRSQLEFDRQHIPPMLVYGNDPPALTEIEVKPTGRSPQLRGIGASPGWAEGRVMVLRSFQGMPDIDRETILVVPYTDSGWAPLLARAGGLIAEVGGQLSHGAIVAREYGIPAVMNVHHATQTLRNGQCVRIDGQQGTVEIISS
jgi:pyruvate,water dikinase